MRLAREANDLRHRLDEAAAAAAEVDDGRAPSSADDRAARRGARPGAAAARARRGERARRAAPRRTPRSRAPKATWRSQTAEAERDDAITAADAAREEQSALQERLNETEAQLTDTERERASLRARAESADRTVAELEQPRATSARAARPRREAKTVAAEDETRRARRDLRDTRARLESLLREQRHRGPRARRGYEVPGEPDADATATPERPEPVADDRTPRPGRSTPTRTRTARRLAAARRPAAGDRRDRAARDARS